MAKSVVQGQLQRDLLQIESDVAKVRGLVPKHDVPEYFVSREQLRASLGASQGNAYSREEERYDSLELWLLRFIPQPSVSLRQLGLDLLSEQLAGYYDSVEKELFVLSGQEGLDAAARGTVAHEFVHSLQDQHFGLSRLLPGDIGDGDRTLAMRSLVEGDATLAEILYADEYLGSEAFQGNQGAGSDYSVSLERVPDIYAESLLFPYTKGLAFAQTLYTRGGWPTIDAALADPPVTTEQILHPEKYLATPREGAMPVGVPPLTDTLGAGWVYRDTDTIGEFELGLMLRENGIESFEAAAQGWGGGQVDFYEKGSNALVIMGTAWDSAQEAMEFELALRQSLSRLKPIGKLWTDGRRYYTVKRTGDRIFYVAGTDRTTVDLSPQAVK